MAKNPFSYSSSRRVMNYGGGLIVFGALIAFILIYYLSQPPALAPNAPANAVITSLIGQLASRNPPPTFEEPAFDRSHVNVPDAYDPALQKAVHDAVFELRSHGENAFPYLIQYLTDERFSRTHCMAAYYNNSVGDMCRNLIKGRVDCWYVGSGKVDECDYFKHKWENDLQGWWNDYWDQPLYKMQVDCLRFKIRKAKQLGFDSQKMAADLRQILAARKSWQEIDPSPPRNNSIPVIDILFWEKHPFYRYGD